MRVGRGRLLWLGLVMSFLVPSVSRAAEGRIPVFAPGTVIPSPGKYVLTRNLDGNGGTPVIEIAASNVELDLNGFRVTNQSSGIGILVVDPCSEVVIRNGDISAVSVGVEFDNQSGGAERAVIEDLRIYAPGSAGIRVANVNNVVVRRVLVYRSFGDGIRISGSPATAGEVADSQINLPVGVGVAVGAAASFAIVDNRIYGSGLEGIRVDSCRACRVDGNTVTAPGGAGGIYVTSMLGGSLSRNTVTQSNATGIRLGAFSSDLAVRGNVSNDSGADGLLVEGFRFHIEGNVLNESNGFGLRFAAGSGYSTFGRNMARNNGGAGGWPCAELPALFAPDSCNDGLNNFTFGDNLIPGPALF